MVITAHNTKQKPGYKQTEIGLIPEDWKLKSFRDVCRVNQGLQIAIENRLKNPTTKSKLYITIQYLNDGKEVEYINDYTSSVCCDKDDILMTRTGNTGFVVSGVEGVFHNNFFKVNYDKDIIDKEFLIYYLKLKKTQNIILTKAGTSTIPDLNHNDFYSIPIPLPIKAEQVAIATFLSDVDALITSLDKLIAKKRDIKQATIQQLLTGKTRLPGFSGEWEVRKLGEIFQFLNTANNSRSDLSEDGEIKYIHYGDIHMKWESFLDCSKDELPLIQRDKVRNVPFLEDGDLVMADASEDYEGTGISVEVKNATGKKVVAGLHTFLLRGDKKALADGFKGYLQYIPVVKDALKKVATGISVYGISKNNVRNISICLPNIIEQQAIATVLSDIDAEIAALEQKRDKTRALKQGMMQELLTGKTRLV